MKSLDPDPGQNVQNPPQLFIFFLIQILNNLVRAGHEEALPYVSTSNVLRAEKSAGNI